jgi:beta-galactosidase
MRDGQNNLVMETEAQGFPHWTPYPGQLRLQAFSHLASGANMVSYWHWATTANAIETYRRGVLSQDYQPNAVYAEVKTIGADLQRLGPKLVNLRKKKQVAVYVSNTAQAGFDAFKVHADGKTFDYNDAMRPWYDALYRMNVEADILSPSSKVPLSDYKLIVVPSLYAASDAAGVRYHQFTNPVDVTLAGDPFKVGGADNKARWWMEFLEPTTAQVIARFLHPSWPGYAAVTRNAYGSGEVGYVGFMPLDAVIDKIVEDQVKRAGIALQDGHRVRYVLNYSAKSQRLGFGAAGGTELLSGRKVARGRPLGSEKCFHEAIHIDRQVVESTAHIDLKIRAI